METVKLGKMMSNTTVQSIDRALNILECIAKDPAGVRLSDIASETELAVSTTHRLLTTLEARGYLQIDPISNRWLIGQKCYSVGSAFHGHQNYVAPALPFLRLLRDKTRETANLGIINQGEIISIAQVESREIMRAIAAPGGRVPLINSGMGKAIMAQWPDDAILNHTNNIGFNIATKNSIQTHSHLMNQIKNIRNKGFAIDDEEFVSGMRCVAAHVALPNAEPRLALSISGLSIRVPHEKAMKIGVIVKEMAIKLSEKLSVNN